MLRHYPPLIVFAHVYYCLLVLLRVTVLMSLLYYHVTMHFWETLTSGAGLMTHCAGGDRLAGRLGPLPTPPCVTMHFWETLTSGAGLMTHCAGGDRLAGRLGPLPTPPCARSLT